MIRSLNDGPIQKFWILAAAGWVTSTLFVFLWRRSADILREERKLRTIQGRILNAKIQEAEAGSHARWIASSLPLGVTIDGIYGNCPVCAEGCVDGFNFDFRARGNNWSFEVVDPNNENEVIEPLWRIERRYGETPFSAGWMPQAEALVFILDAANLFREAQRDIVAP